MSSMEYCARDERCDGCPVEGILQGNVGIELVFQNHGSEIDTLTSREAIVDMAEAESVSAPGLVADAVMRHLTGKCSTSPERRP